MLKTLEEFGTAALKIRETLSSLNINATEGNCAAVLLCNRYCNDIIASVNEAVKSAPVGDVELQLNVAIEDKQPEVTDHADHS